MEQYQGKSILKRIAIGKILFYNKEKQQIKRQRVEDTEAEISRYEAAKKQAVEELHGLYARAAAEVGEENAQIFEVHAMMAEDSDYTDSVHNIIRTQRVNAEYAVASTGDNFAGIFAGMEDEYFQARAVDIQDISRRLEGILQGNREEGEVIREPVILAASELAPSETVQLDKEKLLGFVTQYGSPNSHTAVLARTMNVPALLGIPISQEWDGRMAVMDGVEGILYVDPTPEILEKYRKKQEREKEKALLLKTLRGAENITLDGRRIELAANIGSVADMPAALENDAGSVGLFRSEFLYLESPDYPTEENQFQAYRQAAELMQGKQVIIRTMDIGVDKQADYFQLAHEENPAMGYRAIRICLKHPDMFKIQLRAIYRASAFGNVAIMYPMITSVEEVQQIKALTEAVKAELSAEGIAFGEVKQGIMIETPAAVMISDLLAREVEFFSIGTNDLTQYTLAVDRQNPQMDSFYNPHHEAVLRMIRMVVENGHRAGIWVGICGELAADPALTEEFVRMGVDELSVTAGEILPLRKLIREMDLSEK